MIHFRCVTGSEFAFDYNTWNGFYEQRKSYTTVFLERWLLIVNRDFACSKSTTETLKTLEQDVKCVWS